MFRKLLVGVTFFLLSTLSIADQKVALVEELFRLQNTQSMIDAMYDQMNVVMQDFATQMGLQQHEQELFDEYTGKVTDLMRATMTWEAMRPDMVAIYANAFTVQELEDIIEFSRTESGSAMIAKMPAVMQASSSISQRSMMEIMPELQRLLLELEQKAAAARN